MGQLDNRIAIVTGAAGGMGRAISARFIDEGASVVLTDYRQEDVNAAAKELGERAHPLNHDVTQADDWAEVGEFAGERFGGADVLVNCAGITLGKQIADTTVEDYLRVVQVNQLSVFLGIRTIAPLMVGRAGPSIVNIGSIAALGGSAGTIAYTASKHAVRGMSKVAALELAPNGIRVNAVHPGTVDTGLLDKLRRDGGTAGIETLAKGTPLGGRLGRPEEIAELVLFLASDSSSFCTGGDFVADGGKNARIGGS